MRIASLLPSSGPSLEGLAAFTTIDRLAVRGRKALHQSSWLPAEVERLSEESDVLRVQKFAAVAPGQPWLRGDHSQVAQPPLPGLALPRGAFRRGTPIKTIPCSGVMKPAKPDEVKHPLTCAVGMRDQTATIKSDN